MQGGTAAVTSWCLEPQLAAGSSRASSIEWSYLFATAVRHQQVPSLQRFDCTVCLVKLHIVSMFVSVMRLALRQLLTLKVRGH